MSVVWATVHHPLQRIGLSATQRPIADVARLLVGSDGGDDDACTIVDSGHRRDVDLSVEVPADFELGPIASIDLRTAAFVLAIQRVGRAALARRGVREEIDLG